MGLGAEMSAALYSKLDPGERKNFFRILDLMNRLCNRMFHSRLIVFKKKYFRKLEFTEIKKAL